MFNNSIVAYAQTKSIADMGSGDLLTSFVLPMALFFVVMYVFFIRPQSKKEKEVKDMLANLSIGDTVVTYSGLVGKIVRVSEEEVVMEVFPSKIRLTHKKFAIRQLIEKTEEDAKPISKKDIGKVVAEDDEYIYEEVDENETGDDVEYIEVDKK